MALDELKVLHGKFPMTRFTITTFGATIINWSHEEAGELLFVSKDAVLNGTKAIRGGIPICFPVFGPWSEGRPQHGFARDSPAWHVVQNQAEDTGDITVVFRLTDDERTLKLWPHKFEARYTVHLTRDSLEMELEVTNKNDDGDFDFTVALHTYFQVPDVTKVKIKGLNGVKYVDKTDGGKEKTEANEAVAITGFTDRVYKDAPEVTTIEGFANGKTVTLTRTNFCDVVVWNPWAENAKAMADFGDEEYKTMVCVEAVNFSRPVNLAAGQKWAAKQVLAVADA